MPPVNWERIASKIILSGKPLLINKEITLKSQELGVQRIGVPAASYLGVPIPVGDEIIGVLSVQSTEQKTALKGSATPNNHCCTCWCCIA
jgi:transcriptional regulator with GAF, ATPase, and Fis domain